MIAEAEKVYNSEEATQEQVNEQIVLLEKGIEALEESKPEPEPKPVDKGVLEQKLSVAKKEEAVKTDKYTAESIKNLKAVIAEAEKVYNSEEATQEQVNEQIVLLEKGIEALEESKPEPEPKPVDKGVLEQKLSAAKEEAAKTDKYTAESIKNLKAVIAEAEKVYNSEEATQEQIDAQTKALEKAIDNLKNKEKKPESGSKTSGLDTADRAVETGDKTNLALPLVGGILAFVALAGMLVVRRKKK